MLRLDIFFRIALYSLILTSSTPLLQAGKVTIQFECNSNPCSDYNRTIKKSRFSKHPKKATCYTVPCTEDYFFTEAMPMLDDILKCKQEELSYSEIASLVEKQVLRKFPLEIKSERASFIKLFNVISSLELTGIEKILSRVIARSYHTVHSAQIAFDIEAKAIPSAKRAVAQAVKDIEKEYQERKGRCACSFKKLPKRLLAAAYNSNLKSSLFGSSHGEVIEDPKHDSPQLKFPCRVTSLGSNLKGLSTTIGLDNGRVGIIIPDDEILKPYRLKSKHAETIHSVSFSPDGLAILATSEDTNASLLDPIAGKTTVILKGHDLPCYTGCFLDPNNIKAMTFPAIPAVF